jgi:EAL domain-containing protein (putative c-di-GMP-specific phosphodiesterase class I)
LARFALDPLRPPDAWFAEAAEVGLGIELELTALQLALGALERLPEPLFLSVNLGPAAILRPDLASILERHPRGRILVEITEHIPTIADANLHARLSEIRAAGARIAIDDVGAGYTSLHHILELAPDAIKLDTALTRRVDAEPRNRALIASLVAFAEQVGMSLIAEGVETAAEARTLQELGVSAVQGFYIARPGPLADPFVDPVFPG